MKVKPGFSVSLAMLAGILCAGNFSACFSEVGTGQSLARQAADDPGGQSKVVIVSTYKNVSQNWIIPPDTRLVVTGDGFITIGKGDTLDIRGPFEVGPYQVFGGEGSVIFSGRAAVKAEWWGFSSSATAGINTSALEKAISASDTGLVLIPSGTFRIATIHIGVPIALVGSGRSTVLLNDGKGDAIDIKGGRFPGLRLAHFGIVGNRGSGCGIYFFNTDAGIGGITFHDLSITGCGKEGIYGSTEVYNTTISDVRVVNNGLSGRFSGIKLDGHAHNTLLLRCWANRNSKFGYEIDQTGNKVGNGISVIACNAESNGMGGLLVNGSSGVSITGGYWEFNSGDDIQLENCSGYSISGAFFHGNGTTSRCAVSFSNCLGGVMAGNSSNGHNTAFVMLNKSCSGNEFGTNFSKDSRMYVKNGEVFYPDGH